MTVIRRATSVDAAVLDEMVRELAAHEGSLDHVRVDARGWSELLQRAEVVVFVASLDDSVVGFVSTVRRLHLWTGGDILALDDLYVRPGNRDKGIGADLMDAVARLAARDDLVVTWGVRLDNLAAQRFYARLGATLSTHMTAAWTPVRYRNRL